MDFSEAIRILRQNKYLSQQAFAEELGVSFSTVNRWETSKALPNYRTMKRLVEYCKEAQLDCGDIEKIWKESKNVPDTH